MAAVVAEVAVATETAVVAVVAVEKSEAERAAVVVAALLVACDCTGPYPCVHGAAGW